MKIPEITQTISLAFANTLEAHGAFATQWAKDCIAKDHPIEKIWPAQRLYWDANEIARHLWHILYDLGAECVIEWAAEMRSQAEARAAASPDLPPYVSHVPIERLAAGVGAEAGDPESDKLDRTPLGMIRFALALADTNGTGERPIQALTAIIEARAARKAVSAHPKDVFTHKVCPYARRARIAHAIAGTRAPILAEA